jgi:hypothetical protein
MSAGMLTDAEVMAEIVTFKYLELVYYQHESGVLFATTQEQLPYRHQFKLVSELPADAEPLEPDDDSRLASQLEAWVDSCDSTIVLLIARRDPKQAARVH